MLRVAFILVVMLVLAELAAWAYLHRSGEMLALYRWGEEENRGWIVASPDGIGAIITSWRSPSAFQRSNRHLVGWPVIMGVTAAAVMLCWMGVCRERRRVRGFAVTGGGGNYMTG